MTYEDVYALDEYGRETLIGLSFQETEEFIRLDKLLDLSSNSPSPAKWSFEEEARYLELLFKYGRALQEDPAEAG